MNRNLENEVRESEIKNEMKSKIEYWHECRHCSRQNKVLKIKLLNRFLENEVRESDIKNEMKSKIE